MAKRRDSVARQTKSNDDFVSRINGERWQTRLYKSNNIDATQRKRGRRGVRARAREARIEARIKNGTYTPEVSRRTNIYPVEMRQPEGGNTTNS